MASKAALMETLALRKRWSRFCDDLGIPTDGAVGVQWGAEHPAVGEARRRGVRWAVSAELADIDARVGGRRR